MVEKARKEVDTIIREEGEKAAFDTGVHGLHPEVVKYLVGTGELLANRLLLWDGERAVVEEVALEQDPSCEVCGGKNQHGDAP